MLPRRTTCETRAGQDGQDRWWQPSHAGVEPASMAKLFVSGHEHVDTSHMRGTGLCLELQRGAESGGVDWYLREHSEVLVSVYLDARRE